MSTILSTLVRSSGRLSSRNSRNTVQQCYSLLLKGQSSAPAVLKVRHFSSVDGDGNPMPFVSAPYSYAYGRSQYELIYKTIGQALDERVATETGRPMFISHHENIAKTFTQFNEDVNRVAKAMAEELGLKRGDVVGLWSCNTYNWITIQYACARLGLILCTINPYYQALELDYALRKGDVKALFTPGKGSPQEVVNRFEKILAEALNVKDQSGADPLLLDHIITIDGESYGAGDLPSPRPLKYHSFDGLKQGRNSDLDSKLTSLVTPDDPSIIMFTSGTTGKPKGAFLSQYTLLNNASLAAKSYRNTPPEELSMCCPLPFFHSFAATHGAVAMVASPFQLVIPYLKYDVNAIVDSINQHRATHIVATPTLVIDLLNHVKKNGTQLPSLRSCLSGGASMPVETARQFVEAIPNCTDFRIGYGATELGPASTGSRPSYSFEHRTETIGTPIDFVEIKLVNPETKTVVKLGETGEIHSRGFNTMLGYWKDPVKTAEAIDQSKWYNTGDLGVMDEQGFIKIIGRTKELIIVGGENVYPREIEELLHTHPAILDAHVIGVPDPRKSEEICAWVKLKNGDAKVSEEELKKFCKDNLTYFKVPRYFLFVDAFPVTSVGKAKKFVMREITCKKLGLSENQ